MNRGLIKKQRLRMASSRSRCRRRYLAGELRRSDLFGYATVFFAIALACQRRFQAALFSRWNIEGVSFDFADDIFLLHFAFKPAERAFQRLVIAEFDFCHLFFTCLSMNAIECFTPSSPDNTREFRLVGTPCGQWRR